MKKLFTLLLPGLFSISVLAQDTFSICAIDTITGEVGSAGASCIDENAIAGGCVILSDVLPGKGVIHTQAYWNPNNQNQAHQLMEDGYSPQEIIDYMVENDVQNNPHIRQYGIVDLFEGSTRCAAYTGMNCDDYKNHIIGPNYTVQGNILLGQEILDSMEYYFLNTEGELACKLMAALQGAKVIGADTRCFDDEVSSLSAFLRVAHPEDPDDDLYVDFVVPSTPEGVDPIDILQGMVDLWGGCNSIGLSENNQPESVFVFPNPTEGTLMIDIINLNVSAAKVNIFNSNGVLVLEKTVSSENTKLQLGLEAGIYFYIITDGRGKINEGKLVVK